MKSQIILLLITLATLLSGCTSLPGSSPIASPTAQPKISPPASPAEATPTLPPPEKMPTAKPLWSPTPPPTPTQAPTAKTKALPTLTPFDPAVAALVNGQAIQMADYEQRLSQAQVYFAKQPGFDPQSPEGEKALQQLRAQVLQWMIDQILIEQAAAKLGIQITEQQVEEQITRMKGSDEARFQKWLAANGLTIEALKQQVRMDLITTAVRDHVTASVPREAPQVHVRHILLSQENAARQVLQKLQRGEDFARLAQEYSEDETTRTNGGDLGFLPRGVMPPAFDQAAFSLQPGEISGIVRSEFGYHIIQVIEVAAKRPVPEELWPMVQQQAFEKWLAQQRSRAQIVLNPSLKQ